MIVGELPGEGTGNEPIKVFDNFSGIFWLQTNDAIRRFHLEWNNGLVWGRGGVD